MNPTFLLLAFLLPCPGARAAAVEQPPAASVESKPSPAAGLPEELRRSSEEPLFVKARRLMDLTGEPDAAALRKSIWSQFKQSQARTVSKEDAALLQESLDVAPLRNAFTHLWARGSTEGDLDAAIAFFVSEPGRSYLRASEGFPGPYWKNLLGRPPADGPAFFKARRLAAAAGDTDRCVQVLAGKAAQAGETLSPDAVLNAAAHRYLAVLDDRTRNTALAFFESAAGKLYVTAAQTQARERPGLFRLWLTDWVTQSAQRKQAARGSAGHVDRKRGFSIDPPADWTRGKRGRRVEFRPPGAPARGGGPALLIGSEPTRDFPALAAAEDRRLESGLPGFILRFKEEVTVDGRGGLLLTFLYRGREDRDKEVLKALHLLLDGGRTAWTIDCEAPAKDFERHKEACRKSLLSFKVLN